MRLRSNDRTFDRKTLNVPGHNTIGMRLTVKRRCKPGKNEPLAQPLDVLQTAVMA